MAITKVTNRVLDINSVGVAQLSGGAVPTKLTSEIGALNFRNKIINGNFDIWQRGTSMSPGVSDQYLSDRWKYSRIGSTFTASRQAFTTGQTDVPGEPTYFHKAVVTSVAGSNNYVLFLQHLEDVRTFAGKTVTLSFYAKADSNKPISVEFTQSFGSGGSPSSTVTGIGVQKLNLTTSWQKFTVTASIPSMAGKTIGTDNNHCLNMAFWLDAGSTYNSRTNSLGQQSGTFDIAQVQLEEGPVATPFEQRPIGLELSLCQRYFLRNSTGGQIAGIASTASAMVVTKQLPVSMRITPVISYTGRTTSQAATIPGFGGEYILAYDNNTVRYASYTTTPVAGSLGAFNANYATLSFDAEL